MIIKNWKDKSEYEYLKKAEGYQWRWEFLRRNPEYQVDWDELVESYQQKTGNENPPDLMNAIDRECRPVALLKKWGLIYMVDYKMDDIEDTCRNFSDKPFYPSVGILKSEDEVSFKTKVQKRSQLEKEVKEGKLPPSAGSMTLVMPKANPNNREIKISFDLDKPIAPQIKAANESLRVLQGLRMEKLGMKKPISGRPKPENMIPQLRAYDARSQRVPVSYSKIAGYLHPDIENEYPGFKGNDKVKKDLKAIEKLITGVNKKTF